MCKIETYINPKFASERSALKDKFKNFNFFQVADPEEFKKQNAKNEIKIKDNFYQKQFNLIAN